MNSEFADVKKRTRSYLKYQINNLNANEAINSILPYFKGKIPIPIPGFP